MKRSCTKLEQFILAVMLIVSIPAYASKDQTEQWTLNLYLENDLFSNTDEGYTNGLRAAWVSPDVSDYLEDETLPAWIRSVNQRLTFFHKNREGLKRNVIFSIGQTLLTPQDLNRVDVVENDRPYAAWLFASMGYQTRNDQQMDTLKVSLGMVGPAAIGQQSQDFIHKLRGFETFKGWDNQLTNEFGAIFLWEHKNKFLRQHNESSRFGFDAISHTGIALGNVATYVNAGAEFRLGWSIPNDFGTSALRPGGDNSAPGTIWDPRETDLRRWGMHAFASIDVKLVGHDIFLDGNTFSDSHSVDKKLGVAEAAVGISFIYGGTKVSYAQIFRSKEFTQQPNSHSYGSVAISHTY
jgi:lipid A 3-O-deacylase